MSVSGGFPENKPGTLLNNSYALDNFSHQEYTVHLTTNEYIRWWDSSAWGSLEFNISKILPVNFVNANKLASEFSLGETITRIRGTNSNGLPDETGGTLKTVIPYKIDTGWAYQEYIKHSSFDKYIRYQQQNGNWSAWRKLTVEIS